MDETLIINWVKWDFPPSIKSTNKNQGIYILLKAEM